MDRLKWGLCHTTVLLEFIMSPCVCWPLVTELLYTGDWQICSNSRYFYLTGCGLSDLTYLTGRWMVTSAEQIFLSNSTNQIWSTIQTNIIKTLLLLLLNFSVVWVLSKSKLDVFLIMYCCQGRKRLGEHLCKVPLVPCRYTSTKSPCACQ